MFKASTPKLEKLSKQTPLDQVIKKLESLFVGKVNMYIDFANIRPLLKEKFNWHIDPKRTRHFLSSFNNIHSVKWYEGLLEGDVLSKDSIQKLKDEGYFIVRTKPVKIMSFSIDTTSISKQSPDLLKRFIRKSLLRKYDIATVEYLNEKFAAMNKQGEFYIEDRKCNFDVEIGIDMSLDHFKDGVDTFVLWSCDSDFAGPIKTLLAEGKKVILIATAGKVATELSKLVKDGLFVLDLFDLRDFICRSKEQFVKV